MNKQQKFYTEMQKGLQEINVSGNDIFPSMYPQSLDTKYGKLLIHVEGDKKDDVKSSVFTCYCRFDDVDIAMEHTNCNPYTGKWNFHDFVKGTRTPEEVAQSFIRAIKNVINNT